MALNRAKQEAEQQNLIPQLNSVYVYIFNSKAPMFPSQVLLVQDSHSTAPRMPSSALKNPRPDATIPMIPQGCLCLLPPHARHPARLVFPLLGQKAVHNPDLVVAGAFGGALSYQGQLGLRVLLVCLGHVPLCSTGTGWSRSCHPPARGIGYRLRTSGGSGQYRVED